MAERPVPSLSSICNARLIDASGQERLAKTLWEKQPVLFVLIRRPGCVLCRAEARRVWALNQSMQLLGMKPVCLVHEWLKGEIGAFCPAFWQGEIYLDANKDLYRALSGDKVHKQSWWTYFFNICRAFKLFKEAKQDWVPEHKDNTKGTHMTMGGFLAVRSKDQGVSFCFVEDFWGDHPSIARLLEVCEEAASKKLTNDQIEAQMQTIRNLILKHRGSFKA